MAMFWPPTPYADKEKETTEGVRISNAEQLVIAKELKITKAHGPNGIPNVAVRTAMCAFPDMIRTLPQKCLDEGCSQTYGGSEVGAARCNRKASEKSGEMIDSALW